MAFPKVLTTRYFQLITSRQFTQAKRELERIKQQIKKTEWNKGYYRALRGMLLAQKQNGNSYTLLQNLNTSDEVVLKKHKHDFRKHTQNRFHDDYDRGYFSAWHDYTRLLIKIHEETQPPPTSDQINLEKQTNLAHYTEPNLKNQ